MSKIKVNNEENIIIYLDNCITNYKDINNEEFIQILSHIKITLKNITSKLFTLGIMPFNYSDYNTNINLVKDHMKKLKDLLYNIESIKLNIKKNNSFKIIKNNIIDILDDCDILINHDFTNESLNFITTNYFKYTRIYTSICDKKYESKIKIDPFKETIKIINKKIIHNLSNKYENRMSLSLGIGGLIIIGIYHTTNSCNQSLLIGGITSRIIYHGYDYNSIKRSLIGIGFGIIIGMGSYLYNQNKNMSVNIGSFFGNIIYAMT